MKRFFIVSVILAILGVTSCEKSPSKAIIGTWQATTIETTVSGIDMSMDLAEVGMTVEFTFSEEGKGSAYMESEGVGESSPFEYTAEENLLTLTVDGNSMQLPMTLTKDTLIIEVDGKLIEQEGSSLKIHFTRK